MSAMLAVAPSAPVEVAPVAPVAPVEASEVPQEVQREPERIPSQGSRSTAPSAGGSASNLSAWRWPSQPGKLPLYVQRRFLVKMFGLLAMQLLLCLMIALPVHVFLKVPREVLEVVDGNHTHSTGSTSTVMGQVLPINQPGILLVEYYGLSLLSMIVLILQWRFRTRYPYNYGLLTLATVLLGCFFGISDQMLQLQVHIRLLTIMAVALSFTCASCNFLGSCCKRTMPVVLLATGMGWLLGSLVVVCLSSLLDPVDALAKTCTAFLLAGFVLTFLIVHAWHMLQNSKIDEFAGVAAIMDASLLAVVSLPFFFLLLAFCAPASAIQPQEENGNAANAAGNAEVPV